MGNGSTSLEQREKLLLSKQLLLCLPSLKIRSLVALLKKWERGTDVLTKEHPPYQTSWPLD